MTRLCTSQCRSPARKRRRMRASRSRSIDPMPASVGAQRPGTRSEQDKSWSLSMQPGAPAATFPGGRCRQQALARAARAEKSPGGAPVHPCPRQYVIQPMPRKYGHCRRSKPVGAANTAGSAKHFRLVANPVFRQSVAQQTCRPRRSILSLGLRNAIGHRHQPPKENENQFATRTTPRIRWFLRSIPEPVEYSQYTMPRLPSGLLGTRRFVKCWFLL